MSCNLPNPYGDIDPIFRGDDWRGGTGSIGFGGGYGCVGCMENKDPDYRIGYGVGPGHVLVRRIYREKNGGGFVDKRGGGSLTWMTVLLLLLFIVAVAVIVASGTF